MQAYVESLIMVDISNKWVKNYYSVSGVETADLTIRKKNRAGSLS